MPHRNASDRAAWLDALARETGRMALHTEPAAATAETLREIAAWIRERGDNDALPADTVWVRIDGPALWYFDRTDRGLSLHSARLDLAEDARVLTSRQRAIAKALLHVARDMLSDPTDTVKP
jgi:hypothetical protein